jgi:cysteine desulfurase/selenocysteine lyase
MAGGVGLGAAVDYLAEVGMERIHAHEQAVITYALDRLAEVPGLTLYGPEAEQKGGVATFTMAGMHPHDIAQLLDAEGVAVRAGHHCAMPLHERFGLPATARASFYLYNTQAEVDSLIEALYAAKQTFAF